MIWQKFLKTTFLSFISFAFINEIVLFFVKNPYAIALRHNVDLYANFPPKAPNIERSVILGDSVVNQIFESFKMQIGVVDLTTNQATGISGNYFLLKRYLEQNNHLKQVWLSFIPSVYSKDMSDDLSYTYFFSVFNRPEEISEYSECAMGRSGYDFDLNYKIKHRLDLFSSPWITLNFWSQRWIRSFGKAEGQFRPVESNYQSVDDAWKKIYDEELKLHPLTRCFLTKILRLSEEKNFQIHILINPVYRRRFNANSLVILKNSLKEFGSVTDFNDLSFYDEKSFYDGVHLVNQSRAIFFKDLSLVLKD